MNVSSVSVVIPTHDRCGSLERLLQALERQTWHPRPLEIIVVADGCRDSTEVRMREAWPEVTVIVLHGSGAATARNRGAHAATADLMVFLDDDMEPSPDLVEQYARAGRADTVLLGMSPPVRGGQGFLAASVRAWWERQFRAMHRPGHRFSYRDMLSGNFAVMRETFLRLGGFDEGLRCREDHEFGIRALDSRVSLRFLPAARAIHHDRPTLTGALRRAEDEGEADACIARRHPRVAPALLVSHFREDRPWLFRRLNRLAFRSPRRGDRRASWLERLLEILERFRMRRKWRAVFGALREYRYWRGAARAVALDDLLHASGQASDPAPEALVVDLDGGLERAAEAIEKARPGSAILTLQGTEIGRLPPAIGGEPLAARHLRAALAGPLAGRFAAAVAISGPVGMDRSGGSSAPGEPLPALEDEPDEPAWWKDFSRPRHVLDLELARDVPDLAIPSRYAWVQLLARCNARPVGWVRVARPPGGTLSGNNLRRMAIRQLETRLRPLLFARPDATEESAPPVSVVVCTRDRADLLDGCLEAIRRQDYPQFEIIVVDNASARDDTVRVAASHDVTLVREPRPGLDWARNRGIAAARHDIVAFTDDDARPDAGWLAALGRGFADPEVQGVTGLVLPLELETRAQLLFEEVYGGMGKGFTPQRIRGRGLDVAARLAAYRVGVGANMAFRRGVVEELGGFDTALDVGTPSHGGGDLDMFYRMLAAGHVMAYEPRAVVRHRHRREMSALRRQLRDDGRAFGVYLIKRWQAGDAPRGALLRFVLGHWIPWLTGRIAIGLLGRHRLPLALLWANLQGALGAPRAWISTRRSDRLLRAGTRNHAVEGIA